MWFYRLVKIRCEKKIKGENWNKCQWYSWSGFYDFNATIGQNSLDVLHTVYWLCVWSQIHIRCYDLLLELGVGFLLCHCLPFPTFHPLVCLIEFSRFYCWPSLIYVSSIHESPLSWQRSYFCSRIPSVCPSSTVGPETAIWLTYIMQCNFACL